MEYPNNPSTAEIVENYFKYHLEHDEELFWAWVEVDELVREDPEKGWALIQELLRKAPTRDCINYVACGPLEDLLKRNGEEFFARVKAEAQHDNRLLYALSGIYTTREVEEQLKELLEGIEFEHFDPLK